MEAIFDERICRVVVIFRSGSAIEVSQLIDLVVVEERIARGLRGTDEADAVGAGPGDPAAAHCDSAVSNC